MVAIGPHKSDPVSSNLIPATNVIMKEDSIWKIITEEQFKNNDWWYADGEQPISNGGAAIIVDKDYNPIKLISSCCNCGDFHIDDVKDLKDILSKEYSLKDLNPPFDKH